MCDELGLVLGIQSKGDPHLTGRHPLMWQEHMRGNNSLGAMKYSLIEVAFEAGSWRMSRISTDRHRSKGYSSGRNQNSQGREVNEMVSLD